MDIFKKALMKPLKIFWKFTRPHTIIGSTLSILSLYLLAYFTEPDTIVSLRILFLSLLSALTCNVFITGLNQWSDVEVDKINKPWLPIASGELSKTNALIIVICSGIISLVTASFCGKSFLLLISLILLIGFAYSMPPLKFKRGHIAAASAITLVRGLLVNLGFYLHFIGLVWYGGNFPEVVIPLIIFVSCFSLGIAWFKDIPDTKGDDGKFGTLAVIQGRKFAFYAGFFVVAPAYLYLIFLGTINFFPQSLFAILIHTFALMLFVVSSIRLNFNDDKKIKLFYLFFWGLFFFEYLIFPFCFYGGNI
jgi:homogentisate phytyltransferase/homogentisate geranylgeranyltransferase